MLEFTVTATVAADHPCLAGHFPGRPVVPAVLLLELVAAALREHLGPLRISGVPAAKFLLPMLPDQPLALKLSADPARGRASFRCESGGRLAAHGELSFERL